MIVLYIFIALYFDIVIVYHISKLFWQHGYDKRNFIAFNIVGVTALISGIFLLPYGGVYLIGTGIFNGLFSLFHTDWKELPNFYYMHFNELKGLNGFITEVRMQKPSCIYHPLYHNEAPYAYIEKIEGDTLSITRNQGMKKAEVDIKELYNELAAYRVTMGIFAKLP